METKQDPKALLASVNVFRVAPPAPKQVHMSRWKKISPRAMHDTGSKAALYYALEDARADILTLSSLLERAAYPRRGTADETMTLQQFAEIVQAVLPLEVD